MMKNFLPDLLPGRPDKLEQVIARREAAADPLQPGARARIVWHDEEKKSKTPFSIVYLHGFKSSHGEGDPVHKRIAETFGCNLFLSRLDGHGLKHEAPLGDITPASLRRSALDACRVGQKIGDRLILMGTSTGGALALDAAGSTASASLIHALILYSPLVHLYGIQSLLLENAVGRSLLRWFPGKNYVIHARHSGPQEQQKIWYPSYRLSGALTLGRLTQKLISPALFRKITCPVFTGYYHRDETRHDRVVSTSAIKRMIPKLSTPKASVTLQNFPDAGTHVICSGLLSGAVQEVTESTAHFLETTAHLPRFDKS